MTIKSGILCISTTKIMCKSSLNLNSLILVIIILFVNEALQLYSEIYYRLVILIL